METSFNVFKFIVVVLEAILIFNLLIVVHELGHFLAARWRGLVVEQFAVWFGKPLWKRTYNGVVYSLGSIPFGGFVKLPQMAPMDAIEGESEIPRAALPTVSPLDKIIVAIAGPLFSFGLAFLFAVIVWQIGRPLSETESTRYIGYVPADSPAAKAACTTPGVPDGLRAGDLMLSVDGHPIKRFGGMTGSVVWYVARSEGETIPFEVQRGDQTLTFLPKPLVQEKKGGWWRRKALRQVLIGPAYSSVVKKVKDGSPAAKAGLRENDVVTAVDGKKLWSTDEFFEAEQNHYGQEMELTVARGQQTFQTKLPAMPFKISYVTEGSPASLAGIKDGDLVTSINGAPATRFDDLTAATRKATASEPLNLALNSGGVDRTVSLVPVVPKGESRPMIGIAQDFNADGIGWAGGGEMTLVHELPTDQIVSSVTGIVNTVGAVLAPKSAIGLQHLGGPLFIAQTYFYLLSSEQGWRLALWFSVVLNVNLALLNMLPIPVLDGGHILLAIIESIRRKPVNLRVLEVVQTACFLVIASYMLYVTFFDVGDLASSRDKRREVEFPTQKAAHK